MNSKDLLYVYYACATIFFVALHMFGFPAVYKPHPREGIPMVIVYIIFHIFDGLFFAFGSYVEALRNFRSKALKIRK